VCTVYLYILTHKTVHVVPIAHPLWINEYGGCCGLTERESVEESDQDSVNPIMMTFPIKKRINTELFIHGKPELYIHNRRIKNSWPDPWERGRETWLGRQNTWEWKPILAACLKWLQQLHKSKNIVKWKWEQKCTLYVCYDRIFGLWGLFKSNCYTTSN